MDTCLRLACAYASRSRLRLYPLSCSWPSDIGNRQCDSGRYTCEIRTIFVSIGYARTTSLHENEYTNIANARRWSVEPRVSPHGILASWQIQQRGKGDARQRQPTALDSYSIWREAPDAGIRSSVKHMIPTVHSTLPVYIVHSPCIACLQSPHFASLVLIAALEVDDGNMEHRYHRKQEPRSSLEKRHSLPAEMQEKLLLRLESSLAQWELLVCTYRGVSVQARDNLARHGGTCAALILVHPGKGSSALHPSQGVCV